MSDNAGGPRNPIPKASEEKYPPARSGPGQLSTKDDAGPSPGYGVGHGVGHGVGGGHGVRGGIVHGETPGGHEDGDRGRYVLSGFVFLALQEELLGLEKIIGVLVALKR